MQHYNSIKSIEMLLRLAKLLLWCRRRALACVLLLVEYYRDRCIWMYICAFVLIFVLAFKLKCSNLVYCSHEYLAATEKFLLHWWWK